MNKDPVRSAFLQALADLPSATWQADHLDALAAVLRHGLDAPDLSAGSASHMARLGGVACCRGFRIGGLPGS